MKVQQSKRSNANLCKVDRIFNYYNTTKVNLIRYQISTKDEKMNDDHCFVYTLGQLGFSQEVLDVISSKLEIMTMTKRHLNDFSTLLDCKIVLHYYRSNGRMTTTTYNKYNNVKTIDLALYNNHFFVYEQTIYSRYFTKNYYKCSKYKNAHKIIKFKGKYANRSNIRKADSLTLVRNFMDAGLFKKK